VEGAIDSLGQIGDRSVVEKIRPFLKSSNNTLVCAAIESLDKLRQRVDLSWFDFQSSPVGSRGFRGAGLCNVVVRREFGEGGLPYLPASLTCRIRGS